LKIKSEGPGLQIQLDDSELEGFKLMMEHHLGISRVSDLPDWFWRLDAAVVARMNDIRGENG
jgi:hypothetical protein